MPISWNEIKSRALSFSKEWADETSEDAEAKSFWDGFFFVFGISRKRGTPRPTRWKGIDEQRAQGVLPRFASDKQTSSLRPVPPRGHWGSDA